MNDYTKASYRDRIAKTRALNKGKAIDQKIAFTLCMENAGNSKRRTLYRDIRQCAGSKNKRAG